MVVLRLIKLGKKNQPSYRVVATDKKNSPKGGRFLETLGHFNPYTKETAINKERVEYWLGVGAQASDRVHNILVSQDIIKGKKREVHNQPEKSKENERGESETPESKKGESESKQPAQEEESEREEKQQEEKESTEEKSEEGGENKEEKKQESESKQEKRA